MEDKRISDLIDQYLLGNIDPQDKSWLERRMASDQVMNLRVRESKKAFAVLVAERNRLLRERLRKIDRKEDGRINRFYKKLLIAVITLIGMLGVLNWTMEFYSPASIAMRYFEAGPVPFKELNMDSSALDLKWKQANTAFLQGDFGKASELYKSWGHETKLESDPIVRWNILLTQFVLHGITADWKAELEAISKEAPPPLQARANKLRQFLDSPFYRIFLATIRDHVSAIQPRLI